MTTSTEVLEGHSSSNHQKIPSHAGIYWPPPLFRFIVELTTWGWLFLAGFWYLTIVSLLLLSVFNFPGDKKTQMVGVPGWLRISIEVFSGIMGIVGAWILFGNIGGFLQLAVVSFAFFLDRERWLWMLGRRSVAPQYVTMIHEK